MTRAQFWWLLQGLVLIALLLIFSCTVRAADSCKPNPFDDKVTQVKLTHDQFRFFEGVWANSVLTPDGLPPGDGALMAYAKGRDPETAFIFVTKGKEICGMFPAPVGSIMLKLLGEIESGPGKKL